MAKLSIACIDVNFFGSKKKDETNKYLPTSKQYKRQPMLTLAAQFLNACMPVTTGIYFASSKVSNSKHQRLQWRRMSLCVDRRESCSKTFETLQRPALTVCIDVAEFYWRRIKNSPIALLDVPNVS